MRSISSVPDGNAAEHSSADHQEQSQQKRLPPTEEFEANVLFEVFHHLSARKLSLLLRAM